MLRIGLSRARPPPHANTKRGATLVSPEQSGSPNHEPAQAPASHFWGIAAPVLSGAVLGGALGLLSALLYVSLDPNLSPQFGSSLLRSAPRMVIAFGTAGLAVAGIGVVLRTSDRFRLPARLLALLLPATGLALSILGSPAMPMTLAPRAAGIIVTSSDGAFLIGVCLLGLAGAPLLWRWSRHLLDVGWTPGRWVAVGLVPLCAAIALLASERAAPSGDHAIAGAQVTPLVLIGIDGADWREINPLLARGRLPEISRLTRNGSSGALTTFRPTLSPSIWTSIATGQPPLRHGIRDFLEPGSGIPYTSNTRLVPALWTLIGDAGLRVGVVGWWVTWPAEAVNGQMISAYSNRDLETIKGTVHPDLERQTHPPQLIEELRPLIADGAGWGKTKLASIARHFPRDRPDELFQSRLRVTSFVLGTDHTFSDAAAQMAQSLQPDFLAVYLSAPDTSSHAFCAGRNNPWRERACGRVLEEIYTEVDREIGRIVDAAPADANVMIVSDHGFDRARGHEHGLLHGPEGIIILRGSGVRAGGEIRAASIYDIAPTSLALLGLPIPSDLRGRVLLSAFEPDRATSWPLAFGAPSPRRDRNTDDARAIPAATDSQLKERLRALGYIE
jgi:predicted AlkP superfamily phosphohydrolase/phosphomutase